MSQFWDNKSRLWGKSEFLDNKVRIVKIISGNFEKISPIIIIKSYSAYCSCRKSF